MTSQARFDEQTDFDHEFPYDFLSIFYFCFSVMYRDASVEIHAGPFYRFMQIHLARSANRLPPTKPQKRFSRKPPHCKMNLNGSFIGSTNDCPLCPVIPESYMAHQLTNTFMFMFMFMFTQRCPLSKTKQEK